MQLRACLCAGAAAAICLLSAACKSGENAPNNDGSAGSAVPGPAAAPTGDLPCAVATLLTQHCARCHGTRRFIDRNDHLDLNRNHIFLGLNQPGPFDSLSGNTHR